MEPVQPYPTEGTDRDRWILDRRPPRNRLDPYRPYAFVVEQERSNTGEVVSVATVLLTNRECPWRCVMCDLWRNTLPQAVPLGAIPEQIAYALARLAPATHLKLYNSGSFFDPRAIPRADYPSIASAARQFERVIVESHPALVGDRCLEFRDLVRRELEVAIGLETVHEEALRQLNKRATLAQFREAADLLLREQIDLRVFILVQPPFVPAAEALLWAERSLDFAFECSATAVSLIATRAGNGAMETLAAQGLFRSPELSVIEAAFHYGLCLAKGRVFVDLWDIEKVPTCPHCRSLRIDRLRLMNLSQVIAPAIACVLCGGSA